MGARGVGDRVHGGCIGRWAYRPRRCGLCDHHHTFDTRTGVNNHSSKQHGYYYSLKGDCFVPLGNNHVRGRVPPPDAGQGHGGTPGHGQCPRGRAGRVPGRACPPYPWGVPPICYPRVEGRQFVMPQAIRSSIVCAWLQPQFLASDAGEGVGLPAIPLPPAAAGPSPTPPPGDAIPQMAMADPLQCEGVVEGI